MKKGIRRYSQYVLGLLALAFTLAPINGIGGENSKNLVVAKLTQDTPVTREETVAFDRTNPHIQAAIAVQERHTRRLTAIPEVVGTAVGLDDAGKPAILVFTRNEPGMGVVPETLEGFPVMVKVTGEIVAMKGPATAKVDATARFQRPVPIGVSTGNEGECSAGTIGARVKNGYECLRPQ